MADGVGVRAAEPGRTGSVVADEDDKAKKKADAKAQKKARRLLRLVESTDGNDDPRPIVRVIPGQMAAKVSQVQDLLMEGGVKIYQRGEFLVRAVEETRKDSDGDETTTVALRRIDMIYLADQMNKTIVFQKFDMRPEDWVDIDAPIPYAQTILARTGEWPFHVVTGVINAPTLRPDGSLLSEQGYDARTGLILHCELELPATMPVNPTREDAKAALRLLYDDLLAGFPFVPAEGETKECSAAKSVGLSILITPLVRPAMNVVPLHVITAPAKGTGKSYIADTASMMALGQKCAVMSLNSNDEESEKRLGTMALAGNPIISIDNFNGELGGDTLCQMTTQEQVKIRVLGRSEMPTVPNRFCVFANGNNLRLKGDLTRRAITCRMDAKVPRPFERKFENDPVARVAADRGKYVAAGLTAIRAYIIAGRPNPRPDGAPLTPMNSFGQWSDTVRSALIWCGEADPVDTVAAAQTADPERQAIAAVLEALQADVGIGEGAATTAGHLLSMCDDQVMGEWKYPNLREALNRKLSPRGLAGYLGGILGNPIECETATIALKMKGLRAGQNGYYVDVLD